MGIKFDVAISFNSSENWLGNDLYKLLTKDGLSVYNYHFHPNYVKEKFREDLINIYVQSKINILIYSTSYITKSRDKEKYNPIYHEFKAIWERHVEQCSYKDLFVIIYDDASITQKLLNTDIRFYKLFEEGILNLHTYLQEKLYDLWSYVGDELFKYNHPKGEQFRRRGQYPCKFTITPNFVHDEKGRHDKYGDIEVFITQATEKIKPLIKVYLMPSDFAPFFLSHPRFLLNDDVAYRKTRQAMNLAFYEKYKAQEISGSLFYIDAGESDKIFSFPNVYSRVYDIFLTENFETFARQSL